MEVIVRCADKKHIFCLTLLKCCTPIFAICQKLNKTSRKTNRLGAQTGGGIVHHSRVFLFHRITTPITNPSATLIALPNTLPIATRITTPHHHLPKKCRVFSTVCLKKCRAVSTVCLKKRRIFSTVCLKKCRIFSTVCLKKCRVFSTVCLKKCRAVSTVCLKKRRVFSTVCLKKRRVFSTVCLKKRRVLLQVRFGAKGAFARSERLDD